MKKAFIQSYWLWITSKIILVIMVLISAINILGMKRLTTDEVLVNTVCLIEALLLIVTLVDDFSPIPKFKTLKIVTGIILLLLGIGLFVVLLTISKGGRSDIYFLGFPLAIWIMLIGLFEMYRIPKPV